MARIAWIEDDAQDIDDVLLPLKRADHVIDTYETFKGSITRVDDLKSANLILLDILLPSGDAAATNDDLSAGLDLLTELRRLGVSAPVVVFSARSRRQHEAEITSDMDIRDWIQKPVSRYVLAERVEAVLKAAS